MKKILLSIALGFAGLTAVSAHDNVPGMPQRKPVALLHARIYTLSPSGGTQGVIEDGTLVFDKGKILAVGKMVQIPEDAERIDCSGKLVYPGFITCHSSIGLVEIEAVRASRDLSEAGDLNPNATAQTAYNPDSELIPTIRSNGVLLANVVPEGGTLAGQASLMMLDGWTREDAALKPVSGMMLQFPRMTVMTASWITKTPEEQKKENDKRLTALNDFFEKGRAYSRGARSGVTEQKDIRMEAMRRIFEDSLMVFIAADEYKQILSAIEFAKKFSLRAAIVGGRDSWRCTRELKAAGLPVIIQRTHSLPSRDEEAYDLPYTLPGLLHDAGIRFAFADEGAWQQRNLPFHAGTAVAFGLPEEAAIRALTTDAAQILGVGDRVGSLEAGKDATLFVSAGNALDALGNDLEFAFIQGRKVDLSSKQTRLSEKYRTRYREGGK